MRPHPRLLLALALPACGARTLLREPRDAAPADVVTEDVAPDDAPDVAPVDVAPPEDLPPAVDAPAPEDVVVDAAPACEENVPCTEDVGACELGRTRCADGRAVCRPAGNQLPGTACPGGTCDGRGGCVASSQRSCPMPSETGCGVVFLTGGTFTLGEAGGYRAEPPQNSVTVGGFTLDAYEVTVARFRRFWEAGHPSPAGAVAYPGGEAPWSGAVSEPVAQDGAEGCNWGRMGREYHPANCVDWPTAQAFCVWDGGRLPTEAEWEFAARQHPAAGLTAGRRFPWGAALPAPTCDRAHWNRCPGDDGAATRRVGSFENTAGFFDLAGNVWEWTADLFAPYADARCWASSARANPRCAVNATGYPTIRGGSWFSVERSLLQGSSRDDAYRPSTRSPLVGFRCARTRRD